jgi:hypothetical protein
MEKEATELESLTRGTPGIMKFAFGVCGAMGAVEAASYFAGHETGGHALFNMAVPAAVAFTLNHLRYRLREEELKDVVKDLKGQLVEAKNTIAEATAAKAGEVAEIAAQLGGPKLNAAGPSL